MAKDDKTEKATPKRQERGAQEGPGRQERRPQRRDRPDRRAVRDLRGRADRARRTPATRCATCSAGLRTQREVSTAAGLNGLFHMLLNTMLATVAPIAGTCLAVGVLANVAQVGFRPSMTALKPDIKRVNPAAGLKNLFGTRIFFELGQEPGEGRRDRRRSRRWR